MLEKIIEEIQELTGEKPFKRLKEMIGAGTVEMHKIVNYGFQELEDNPGTYCFTASLANGEVSLVILVKEGVVEEKIIDTTFEDECEDYFVNSNIEYWRNVRREYLEIITDMVSKCVKPEGTVYLVPEQIAYLSQEQARLLQQLEKQSKTLNSVIESREVKVGSYGEGGGGYEIDSVGRELGQISYLTESITELERKINNAVMPMPSGDTIMVGSCVEYSSTNASNNSHKVFVIEDSYDASVRSEDGVRFCMTTSNLGEAIYGHEVNDVIDLPNGRSAVITCVDNDYIYDRYAEEYQDKISESLYSHSQKTR